MVTIISTRAVKERFFTALSAQVPFDRWLTPGRIPCGPGEITKLTGEGTGDTVIIFSKYGNISPAGFPPAYDEGRLTALFYYRTYANIASWLAAMALFKSHPPQKALTLGMLKPIYVKWADVVYSSLAGRYQNGNVSKHLPDTTTNLELAELMSRGCRLAMYVGHGRSRGWSGYRGFRWSHIDSFEQRRPVGTVISASCSSLKQDKKESMPMGIEWVMSGRDCAFFGTTETAKLRPLERLTRLLLECLSLPGTDRVDKLMTQLHGKVKAANEPELTAVWSGFRLIGNPFQPL